MSSSFRLSRLFAPCAIVLGFAAACSSRPPVAPTPGSPMPSWANLPITAAGEEHLGTLRQLTTGESARDLVWSADGAALIFSSKRPPDSCTQIFVLDRIDGSSKRTDPRLVSSGRGWAGSPSPLGGDGSILFAANEGRAQSDCGEAEGLDNGKASDLYSVDRSGSERKRLTRDSRFGGLANVSRSGRVVVNAVRGEFLNLATIAARESTSAWIANPIIDTLTADSSRDEFARFSDDGGRIVYASRRNSGKFELRIVRSDGRDDHAVTANGATNLAPAFFPGRADRILFSSNLSDPQRENFDLWAVNADGTELERLTYHPAFDGFGSLSPDGRRIAFVSSRQAGRPGERNIFVADWIP